MYLMAIVDNYMCANTHMDTHPDIKCGSIDTVMFDCIPFPVFTHTTVKTHFQDYTVVPPDGEQ